MREPLKSLRDLRKALKRAAWNDQTPDDLRPLLEDSAKTMGVLSRRLLRMAQWCETVEGYTEELEKANEELEALVNHLGGVQDEEGEQ
jgi:nitrate/nitrite-specific signal transduction histidine kinase